MIPISATGSVQECLNLKESVTQLPGTNNIRKPYIDRVHIRDTHTHTRTHRDFYVIIHVYIYIYLYIYIYIYIYIHIYTDIRTYYIRTHTHTHMHVCFIMVLGLKQNNLSCSFATSCVLGNLRYIELFFSIFVTPSPTNLRPEIAGLKAVEPSPKSWNSACST